MSPAETIASDIAQAHGLTLADLKGPSRKAKIIVARREAIVALRQIKRPDGSCRYSTTWIGRLFGGRDHTTTIHHCRRHVELREACE